MRRLWRKCRHGLELQLSSDVFGRCLHLSYYGKILYLVCMLSGLGLPWRGNGCRNFVSCSGNSPVHEDPVTPWYPFIFHIISNPKYHYRYVPSYYVIAPHAPFTMRPKTDHGKPALPALNSYSFMMNSVKGNLNFSGH